ncbi:MAG: SIMPL domain-containing protein [Patescibacteria group bacterium]
MNNNQEKVWKVGKWVGILLIILLAVVSIKQLKSIGDSSPILNTISVNGKGESVSIPDIATFSFSVNEIGKTVAEAQSKATAKINNVLKSIKAGGVADNDIKTLSYSINPHYEYTQVTCTQYACPPGKSVLTGYDVSQTIEVKIRNLEKAGELFDTIGTAGIQTVNGLSFAIDDMDSVKAIARAEAIKDAKMKAQKIAKELGVKLVKVTSFYDSSDELIYPYAREGMGVADVMMTKASIAPEIPKGEQKVTARVTITYEIR